jgi:hypothetical protein
MRMTEWINTDLHINNKRLNRVLSGYRGKLAKGSNTVAKVATIKVAVGNGKLSLRLSDDAATHCSPGKAQKAL